ncbi:hypothetical protein [Vineibacter terrae]|uniref:hypothetical protein n=1 Tax=Vineibacter terrae TaxID=2586908 RepID=UPI002E2F5C10|nr:hypothetical protein [Vineibacter terrae]HEX2885536.1 hypothetical protein [Vineibacter terrae]
MHRMIGMVWAFMAATLATALAAPPGAPADSARAFYAAYEALRPSGVPNAEQRGRLRSHVSPVLDGLLAAADAAEARHAKRTRNEVPPLVEGDLFTSLFEGATRFTVTSCTNDDKAAVCQVALSYKDGRSETAWLDRVHLVPVAGRWVVDDIEYAGGWDFARRGRLSDVLKAVAREADR